MASHFFVLLLSMLFICHFTEQSLRRNCGINVQEGGSRKYCTCIFGGSLAIITCEGEQLRNVPVFTLAESRRARRVNLDGNEIFRPQFKWSDWTALHVISIQNQKDGVDCDWVSTVPEQIQVVSECMMTTGVSRTASSTTSSTKSTNSSTTPTSTSTTMDFINITISTQYDNMTTTAQTVSSSKTWWHHLIIINVVFIIIMVALLVMCFVCKNKRRLRNMEVVQTGLQLSSVETLGSAESVEIFNVADHRPKNE